MAAAGQDVARTLGHQCMGFLGKLADYSCSNGETKRTQLAMLGQYPNNAGVSAGFFRSGLGDQFVNEMVQLQDNNGKLHSIVLSYLQRRIAGDATQSAFDPDGTQDCTPCTAGTVTEYQEVLIDVSSLNTFCLKTTFQNSQWIQRCEDPSEGMMRRFLSTVDAILDAADVFLLEQTIALAGANANHPVIPGTVPDETLIAEYRALELVDVNRNVQWAAVDQVFEDIDVNELNDCPAAIFFGHKGAFATYKRAEAFQCCNDAGADLAAVAAGIGFAPFQSKNVEAAFDTYLLTADAITAALVVRSGSVHLLEVFKYEHHPFSHGNSLGMVWTDPESGERFDLKVYFDDCNEITTMTLAKHVGVFVAPTDQYQAGDHLANINGVMLYSFTRGT